jgi:predicted ATPase/DNA-binding SARP family transcriptional activator
MRGGGLLARVEFRLLGPMEVCVDGATLPLPRTAERAVLALLLLTPGRTVSATALVDRLWAPESLPANPVNAMQVRVSKLRRALTGAGADVVVRDGAGYRVDVDPAAVDVARFAAGIRAARRVARERRSDDALARYGEALGLWRGDPLTDFASESWAVVETARLSQLRLAALAERAELALALGRHGEVAADLGPVVADDPAQEGLAGLLMTALYQEGQQAEALAVYARTRAVLGDELGLDPSAELRALRQRILRQDPALRPVAPPASASMSAPDPGGNVRAEVSPLIGREQELASLRDLLGKTRLLSLVGPGGAGKTALSLAVARGQAAAFPSGAWVVGLATAADRAGVELAVADALGVPLDGAAPGRRVRDRLLSCLAQRRLLLVLDNCEHVIDAVARLVDDILARCPGVTILATSREALAVPGEVQVAIPPLPSPPDGTPPERVLDYPAVELLVQRATAARPGRRFDEADLVDVARLAASLDGMPLALELAAARLSALAPQELADRLTDRFAVLGSGARTANARHRTLRATVDWSHALLGDLERRLFRRLAVFHGGWTLDAAEVVAAGDGVERAELLDVLGRLIDQSMVIAEPGNPTRYRMLETLRQYAAERLDEAGERSAVEARHAAHFGDVATSSEGELRGTAQRATVQRLRKELPNLRAALAWLSADPSRLEDALRLAAALGWFWNLGRHVEGRDVLRRLAARDGGSPEARARLLQAVSLVERPRACLVHPSERCTQTARESLALFAELGDMRRAAMLRVLLAVEGVRGRDPHGAAALLREAENQFEREDDPWGRAVVAFVRLETFLKAGDEDRALPVGHAAVAAFRALDDPWGCRRCSTTWVGGCGSSAATARRYRCLRRPPPWRPRQACTTPRNGRSPTWASPCCTWASRAAHGCTLTGRGPGRRRSGTAPGRCSLRSATACWHASTGTGQGPGAASPRRPPVSSGWTPPSMPAWHSPGSPAATRPTGCSTRPTRATGASFGPARRPASRS